MSRPANGFSLYELIITLAIATSLIVIGVPAMGRISAAQHQHAEINALFHAVYRARKESVVRRRAVSICPSADAETCGRRDDWSKGWLLFVNDDNDRPARRDPGEILLYRHRVAEQTRIDANRSAFTLRAIHRRATNGTLIVCDRAGRTRAKALVVSWTGRPRVAVDTTRGEPYRCAD